MFEHIKAAPADPVLGLGEAFKSETRENENQFRYWRL